MPMPEVTQQFVVVDSNLGAQPFQRKGLRQAVTRRPGCFETRGS